MLQLFCDLAVGPPRSLQCHEGGEFGDPLFMESSHELPAIFPEDPQDFDPVQGLY